MARPRTSVALRNSARAGLSLATLRAAASIGKTVGKGARKITDYMKTRKQTNNASSNNTMDTGLGTFQRDVANTYRRRRAPRRIRKRAQRNALTFQKNMSTLLGGKFYVDNFYRTESCNANQQGLYTTVLMNSTQVGRIFNLFGTDNQVTFSPPYDFADLSKQPTELMIKRVRQEVEVKNTSTSLTYVDLYYFSPRKDTALDPDSAVRDTAFQGTTNSAYINNANTATQLNANANGVTPFHQPAFTENFVIYKTRRVLLQANQSFTFATKMGKASNQSNRDWSGQTMRRNLSSGVVVIFQGEVNATGTGTLATSLSFHTQVWASAYKLGGKGTVSQTFAYSGVA